ncbi:MAG TPA: inorganic pyrophosphatase [Nevskiaceae bacterium]
MSAASTAVVDHVVHPWHGIDPDLDADGNLTVFIELVPGDNLKFELDKPTGWLRIDRPQKFSSRPPAMYGLVPRTYCGAKVGARCTEVTGKPGIKGDGDPMDVMLLSEFSPAYGGLIARARVVGGIRMIDGGEADDKILTVLDQDALFGNAHDIGDLPKRTVERLHHYLLTYKQPPAEEKKKVEIAEIYGRAEALNMVRLSAQDYRDKYGV